MKSDCSRKTKRIEVRITDKERAELEDYAASRNLTISEAARLLIKLSLKKLFKSEMMV